MEVLASRRSALLAREADLQRRIRELGSLPTDAFEKYKGKAKKVGKEGKALLLCFFLPLPALLDKLAPPYTQALHKMLEKVVADIGK